MNKKTLIIFIVILVISSSVSFFAGMKYEDYYIAHFIQRAAQREMQQMPK